MTTNRNKLVLKAFIFWGIFEVFMIGFSGLGPMVPPLALGIVLGGLVTALTYLLAKYMGKSDSFSLKELGMQFNTGSLKRYFVGLAIGVILIFVFFGLNIIAVPVDVEIAVNMSLFRGIFLSLITFTILSSMEELAFRGYFLRTLDSAIGTRLAVYITSICFGLYHGLNVESALFPAVWGLVYAGMALWSKGLALPIGFHAGVNYVQALYGEKLRYAEGVWTTSVESENLLSTAVTLSYGLQAIIFVTGIVMIEMYIRRQKSE